MSRHTSIVNSNIITSKYDGFWEDLSLIIPGIMPKPVLIIVNDYTDGSAEEQQLKKMLGVGACGLMPDQYNIIKLNDGQTAAWHQLREKLNPQIILLFGIMPVQLGISALFKINDPNHFNDRIWLPTLSLKELEQRADARKDLWHNGMKPVFVDKRFG